MQQARNLRKRPNRIWTKGTHLSLTQGGEELANIGDVQPGGHGERHVILRMFSNEMVQNRINSRMMSGKRITRDPNFQCLYIGEDPVPISGSATSKNIQNSKTKSSPRFLSDRIMKRMTELVFFGFIFCLLPWSWNKDRNNIEKRSRFCQKVCRIILIVMAAQSVILGAYQCRVFYRNFYSKNVSNKQAFMSGMGLVATMYNVLKNITIYLYGDQFCKIRQFINKMLELNHGYAEEFLIHLNAYEYRGGILVHPIFYCYHALYVASHITLYLRKPFLSQYMFSLVYPNPWYWRIPGGIHQLFVSGQIILFSLLVLWILMTHSNTLRFWLPEIHNGNESDYTNDDIRTTGNAVRIYKELEMLNRLFNECMRPVAIPTLKLAFATAMAPGSYVLIRSMNLLSWHSDVSHYSHLEFRQGIPVIGYGGRSIGSELQFTSFLECNKRQDSSENIDELCYFDNLDWQILLHYHINYRYIFSASHQCHHRLSPYISSLKV